MAEKNTDSIYLQALKFSKEYYKLPIIWLFKNTRILFLALFALIFMGVSSFTSLPRELNPEVNISVVNVVTLLPGANPLDVEDLITKKLEKEIGSITSIDTMTSNSTDSLSVVSIQFQSGTDRDKALQDVKEKVDLVTDLPENAETPQVTALDFNDQPVLQVALTGETDQRSLSSIAEALQDELEGLSVVRKVELEGNEEEELVVAIQADTLQRYGVSAEQVSGLIQANNLSFPAGSISVNQTEYQLSLDSKVLDAQDLRSLQIPTSSGSVSLGELANVYYASKDDKVQGFFQRPGEDRKNAVKLSIFKNSSATITAAAEITLERLESEIKEYPQVELVTILDMSDMITDQFAELGTNFRDTVFLVFITLFIFLGLRQSTIASLSIPLTFLSTFTIMSFLGVTLNFLSLFSLLLALGLVVDDAIVIVQAAHRYSQKFKDPIQMGLLVFKDFVVPIWTTTITTVWAFVPLFLSTGIIGEFIKSIPIVVTATLLSSTTVAVFLNLPLTVLFSKLKIPQRVTITAAILGILASIYILAQIAASSVLLLPLLLAWILFLIFSYLARKEIVKLLAGFSKSFTSTRVGKILKRIFARDLINNGILNFSVVSSRYRVILNHLVRKKRNRFALYAATLLFGIVSIFFSFSGLLKAEFFPKTDQEQMYINVEGPAGWKLVNTKEVLEEVKEEVLSIPEVEKIFYQTGNTISVDLSSTSQGEHLAYLTIVLPKEEERGRTSVEIAEELREKFVGFNKAQVSVIEATGGPPAGADFQANIYGDDLEILEKISNDFQDTLKEIPEATNVSTSLSQSAGQIKVELNSQELAERGLTAAELGSWLRTAVTGSKASDFTLNNTELDITMHYAQNDVSLSELQNLRLPSKTGNYALAEVADLSLETSPTSVEREDAERVVRVTAATKGVSAPELLQLFEEQLADYEMPAGYRWDVGGANEENQESTNSIIQAMGVSVILILITMVLQLNSFRKAFLVLAVIPLAVAGVFFNFTLFGIPLSFPALIGVLALFGIVVNNAIMLVEKINQNISFGLPFIEAIVDACSSRTEAIFFTSLTTSIGLLPITISDPLWRGLGGAIIAGLSVSGLLILFLLPALYVEVFQGSES